MLIYRLLGPASRGPTFSYAAIQFMAFCTLLCIAEFSIAMPHASIWKKTFAEHSVAIAIFLPGLSQRFALRNCCDNPLLTAKLPQNASSYLMRRFGPEW